MENEALVLQLNKELAIEMPVKLSAEELHRQLSTHINQLIQHHFEQLVSLLYRIDVSEAKIKSLLQHEPGQNAGDLIATLIIERQLQKIKTRQQFKQAGNNIDEADKW